VTRFLPAGARKTIDAIYAKYGSVIQLVTGIVVVAACVGIFLVALAVKSNGQQTDQVVADGQVSRFVNTLAACEKDNAQNAAHNDFWLLQIALSPQKPPEQALEVFTEGLRVFYPNEPDCAYVAYSKVCVGAVLRANPRCVQYVKEHDVTGKRRAFTERAADLDRRRHELLDQLSPKQRELLNRA
jgi:hypothetical protein